MPPRWVMNEEEIFHEALARSGAEERSAYLEQACAGDAALRASVEALLRANVGATGFLDQPAPAADPSSPEASWEGDGQKLRGLATLAEPLVSERPGTVI